MTVEAFQEQIRQGIPDQLPPKKSRDPNIPHAPIRNIANVLTPEEKRLALKNALRYFPEAWHAELAEEFAEELEQYGRIYMYRFMPDYPMYARPITEYPARHPHLAAIMLMIQNNLDPTVAKFPQELITYGGNGAVFQNWAQYMLTMQYLSQMDEHQTLVLYSGHPLGVFPSHPRAPRVVVTNGMMVPNYSKKEHWNKYNALGVTQYGQMTAGSFMYIGPQGIVHGTTITIMNAGRLRGYGDSLQGRLFVSSGLGGMSGAQAIAAEIAGATAIIAEVDRRAIDQRIQDGYIRRENVYTDIHEVLRRAVEEKERANAVSLIYHGNVVDLWEALVREGITPELGSDQTSLHNVEGLGYCPVGYTYEEAQQLLQDDYEAFMRAVRQSLRRHVDAINRLAERGMYFWDYGNAFLLEAGRADADIWLDKKAGIYRYKSYVEDIMGPMCFDLGFGPFRWVCTSGLVEDLQRTDVIALAEMEELLKEALPEARGQWRDNIRWIQTVGERLPIVGSKARILYADAFGRIRIAHAFNRAIRKGIIRGPIVLGRDHHDVSGTDSPYRETSNIYDGSRFTADMSVHNVIGDAFRGATWVSLHNGGGVGWGEAINGGFGLVLDGSDAAEENLQQMLFWDVANGIARRAWARNPNALRTAQQLLAKTPALRLTIPHLADDALLKNYF